MADKKVIDWIKKGRRAGYDDVQLRELLIKQGRDSIDVDDAIMGATSSDVEKADKAEAKARRAEAEAEAFEAEARKIRAQAEVVEAKVRKIGAKRIIVEKNKIEADKFKIKKAKAKIKASRMKMAGGNKVRKVGAKRPVTRKPKIKNSKVNRVKIKKSKKSSVKGKNPIKKVLMIGMIFVFLVIAVTGGIFLYLYFDRILDFGLRLISFLKR